jgi:hypothetical protein
MRDRPLSGSCDWREAASVLDVAADAISVRFGVLLAGSGAVHLVGPRFEVVEADEPVTRLAGVALAAEPRGLDFGPA